MKRVLFFVLSVFFTLFPFAFTAGEIIDRIVAVVNDDIITLKEVEQFVHVEKKERFKSVDDYVLGLRLRDKLEILIEGTLIKQQAKKMKIDVSEKEVQAVIENIKRQNLITEDELKEQLRRENITYEDFIKGIKLSLLRNKVLARVITPEINLSEKDLMDYYKNHPEEFTDEEIHIHQIFISGLREDSKERAKRVYESIKEGVPFEELAKTYSDDPSGKYGGDVGFVKKGDLMPELGEALKGLKEGEYTGIVQSRYGFHILKVVERKKGEIEPFENVKDEIRKRLIMRESEKRYKDYIEKLKKNSYIEVKL
ncbi:MAG: peptidylprolyl isomerase [Desulfobacterota bacterium]|nr:peptidylprolyl isomerase [Thermodesulfobacteriota bacterium]MDW8001289.1 peptidylprolyl isomerase [Deltaproteobacteria bacterium]